MTADAERALARTDVAVVSRVALRADIDRGPITYAEVAEALAYGHPVVRANLSGRELEQLAAGVDFVSGPSEFDPDRTYSVAASEMLLPNGHPVGTEVEALSRYLAR